MRIISDFKDYYDTVLGFGSEPNLVYLRKTMVFETTARLHDREEDIPQHIRQAFRAPLKFLRQLPCVVQNREPYPMRVLKIPITKKIVGFCGVLFALLETNGVVVDSVDRIIPHLSDEYLREFGTNLKEASALLLKKSQKLHWYSSALAQPLNCQSWDRVVDKFSGMRFDEVFIAAGVPVFKLEYTVNHDSCDCGVFRCTLNPPLRTEFFQKIKPPAVAFQEISMYVGNQLTRQMDPISAVPDDIMRDEKGFDEWSFRRHREESKKNRKAKNPE